VDSLKFEVFSYCIPFKTPLKLKGKTFATRKGFILKHTDVKGRIGYGEVAPLPFFSKESLQDAFTQLKEVIHAFKQKKGINFQKIFPSLAFGLTCSFIKELPEKISLSYSSLLLGSPQEILKKISSTLTTSIKVKAHSLDLLETIDLFKELKKLYPDKKIRVDFNQSLSFKNAIQFCKSFQPTDFEFLEEPCITKQESLQLSKETQFPTVFDESLPTLKAEELPYIAGLVIKPTIVGNISENAKSKPLIFSSSFESKVGIYHILRLAEKSSFYAPGIDTSQFMEDNITFSLFEQTQGKTIIEKPLLNTENLCYVPLD
jgi:O-succinylbenzoate synthase